MFEQSVVASSPASRRVLGTFVGFGGQAVLVSIAVLAPMVFPQILPRAALTTLLVAPGAPPPPAGPGTKAIRPKNEVRAATQIRNGGIVAPIAVPPKPQTIVDPEPAPDGAGVGIGVPGGIGQPVSNTTPLGEILSQGTPPVAPVRTVAIATPEPQRAAQSVPRVRVGTGVKMATLISRVEPVYPPLARQMRVSGTVELEGIIGTDGRLKELRVKSGHPLLAHAALEAVRQWIYQPTTLNGTPVEVIAPIIVTFILN